MDIWNLVTDVVVLLAGALLLGGVSARLGQSPLVGYLAAGMLLGGPGSLRVIQSEHEIETIAELGVSLLLFSLGLEFSFARLRKLGFRTLLGGALQVVVTLIVCAAGAMAFGLAVKGAIAFGAMVSLSSTAVVLRVFMERRELESPHGRIGLGVLLVQDMAVVPLAVLVALLSGGDGGGGVAANVGRVVLLSAGLVAGLYGLLNHVAVWALGALTLERNRELTVILAVVTGLGSAWAAHAVGISPALGAFVAGMFLGNSPFATLIRADISSLRVVLLTLFFATAGMVADPIWMMQHTGLVVLVTLMLGVVKMAVVWGIFQSLGHGATQAAAAGISLGQIGEFAFVLGSIAHAGEVITTETQMLVVSVTILSLLLSSFIVPHAGRLGRLVAAIVSRASHAGEARGPEHGPAADVVLIGFGPAGRTAAAVFAGTPIRLLVVDLNRQGVRDAESLGLRAMVGDATQEDVLEHAHVASAKVVVVTVPHHASAIAIVQAVVRLAPEAHLVVRSRYERDKGELQAAGAEVVFGDESEIGDCMGHHLRAWLRADVKALNRDH